MKTNLIGISGKIGSGKDTVGKILQYLATPSGSNEFTLEDYLTDKSSYLYAGNNHQIKKYADKLKEIVCLLISCTREQLEDREFKEKELGEEWWYYVNTYPQEICREDYVLFNYLEWKTKISSDYNLIKLTPRKLLQLLGTDCGRDIIHPNIWVNALFADYDLTTVIGSEGIIKEYYPNWIITDVRFPNEAQAIKDRGGILIRVERPIDLRFPKLWKLYASSNKYLSYSGGILAWLLGHDKEMSEKLNHPSEIALDDYEFDHVIENNGSIEELVEKVKQLKLV